MTEREDLPASPHAPAPPARATSGVRAVRDSEPTRTPRWNPGARYRPSVLATLPKPDPLPTADAAAPAGHLPGRLFRGPARRTAVFEREVWRPVPRRAASHAAAEALAAAVERYRRGALDTSGLVRAIGHALAA